MQIACQTIEDYIDSEVPTVLPSQTIRTAIEAMVKVWLCCSLFSFPSLDAAECNLCRQVNAIFLVTNFPWRFSHGTRRVWAGY